MATTARRMPLKRKVEEALAGYFIDSQKADPAFLPGLAIVCGTTGRSPDDPLNAEGPAVEPELPYLVVACGKCKETDDLPPGSRVYECDLAVLIKTHASDEARALADERLADVDDLLEDVPPIQLALNQPDSAGTPDTRRVKQFYLTDVYEAQEGDDHDEGAWVDHVGRTVLAQGGDPARS